MDQFDDVQTGITLLILWAFTGCSIPEPSVKPFQAVNLLPMCPLAPCLICTLTDFPCTLQVLWEPFFLAHWSFHTGLLEEGPSFFCLCPTCLAEKSVPQCDTEKRCRGCCLFVG